jgi:hypothetical protein
MTNAETRNMKIRSQYLEAVERFSRNGLIDITHLKPTLPELARIKVTAYFPTFIAGTGQTPVAAQSAVFFISVKPVGETDVSFVAFFPDSQSRVAHPNVYANGAICTNSAMNYTSVCSIVEKGLRTIAFDPGIDEYPRACKTHDTWFVAKKRRKEFPTIDLSILARRKAPAPVAAPETGRSAAVRTAGR